MLGSTHPYCAQADAISKDHVVVTGCWGDASPRHCGLQQGQGDRCALAAAQALLTLPSATVLPVLAFPVYSMPCMAPGSCSIHHVCKSHTHIHAWPMWWRGSGGAARGLSQLRPMELMRLRDGWNWPSPALARAHSFAGASL